MFSGEIRKLLVKVISSWQVIAATSVLIVYFYLVTFVARSYRKKRPRKPPKPKAKAAAAETPEATVTDDLGLEESPKK